SKNLLDEVMPGEKIIGVVTQRNPDSEDPRHPELNGVGVASMILKLFKLPDGNQSIIVHGLTRFRLVGVEQAEPFLLGRVEVLELQSKIQSQVKENIDKSQRRYYLQEQLKAIRKELGEGDAAGASEVESLREKVVAAKPPEGVLKEANRELSRLDAIPSASP